MDAEPPRIIQPSDTASVAVHSPDFAPPATPQRTLELGVAGFLMSGGPAGGYIGVSPFLTHDFGHGVLVRPSLLLGQAASGPVHSDMAAARVDTCARLDGAYATGSGMQLDLCGGLDAGFAVVQAGTVAGTPANSVGLPYLAIGPSVDLRAEIGRLAVTLRAAGGVSVARDGFTDVTGTPVEASPWALRVELGFSWDVGSGGDGATDPAQYEAKR